MRESITRVLLLACCSLTYFLKYPPEGYIIALLLLGFVWSSFDILLEQLWEKREPKISPVLVIEISILLYDIACMALPPLLFFLPVVTAMGVARRARFAHYLSGAVLIFAAASDMSLINALPLALGTLGYLLGLSVRDNRDYASTIMKERDYSKEYEMVLEQKNKALIQNQDNEIYTATLRERNRIAREIHDNVGHMLTRSILQTGAIKVLNKDESLAPALEDLSDTLNQAMTNIRSSVHDLHDESVDLETALTDIKNSITGFNVRLDLDIGENVPRDIKYAFLSIVKEAVSNSVKHCNGDTIRISVNDHPGFYQLAVEDNGTDIDVNYGSGIGLGNISDRVDSIGGTLRISTDNGFHIRVTVMKKRKDEE